MPTSLHHRKFFRGFCHPLLLAVLFFVLCNRSSAQIDKEFWFAAPEVDSVNHPIHGLYDRPVLFRITTESKASQVKISMPANPAFTPLVVNIAANATSTVDLTPWINQIENDKPNIVQQKGLLIQATENITAYYEVQSAICRCNPELFALKGGNAIGNEFFVPSQTTWAIDTIRFPNARAAFDIVATEDNTSITVVPSKPLVGRPAGVSFNITLNRGETYSCQALYHNGANLLNGSRVFSNKPVAVTTKEDLMFSDGDCADLTGDQLVPTSVLGNEYAVVRGNLSVRDKAVVLATQNGTGIFLNGNATPVATINAGQSYEVDLTTALSSYIKTTQKVYVLHYTGSTCEVGSAIIPKLNCTGSKSVSIVRSDADGGYVLLVTKNGNQGNFTVNGNGSVITASDFSPLPGTGGAYVFCKKEVSSSMSLGTATVFANGSGIFQLGFLNGSSFYGGCLYGYFSDYKKIKVENARFESCANDSVQLNALGGVTYRWSPSLGLSNPNIANPKASPGISTLYKVVITDEFGCVDSTFVDLQIKGEGAIDFSYKQAICNPLELQFFSTDSTGSLSWRFGDGSSPVNAKSPVHTFPTQGDYKIQLTVSDDCITKVEKTFRVTIQRDNVIKLPDTVLCNGSQLQLKAETALEYCWNPSTYLSNAFIANPIAKPQSDITYYVVEKVAGTNLVVNGNFNAGNSGFTSEYVFAFPNVTEGQCYVGNNPQTWNAALSKCGDHTSGTGNMLLVNGSPAADLKVWSQTIAITPNTDYEFSTWIQALWPPNPAKLQFSINGVNLGDIITASIPTCTWARFNASWNSGIATSAVISIVNKNTEVQGNDFALDDISFIPTVYKTDSIKIIVDKPSVKASNDTSICTGSPVQLNASGAQSYTWQPNAGLNFSSIPNPVATPSTSTNYVVTGKSSAGCTATDTVRVTVLGAASKFDFDMQQDICNPLQVRFNASGNANVSWDFGDGSPVMQGASPTHTFQNDAVYLVSAWYNQGSCIMDTVKKHIGVTWNYADLIVGNDSTICADQSLQLQSIKADDYCWSPGIGLSSTSVQNPVVLPGSNRTYYLTSKIFGNNVIVNGDFSAGNSGFTSEYDYGNIQMAERYLVDLGPGPYWSNAPTCTDHTTGTGNMMLVNGAGIPGVNVWSQTVNISPRTTYEFSCWVENISRINTNLCKLQFAINDIPLGLPFRSDSTACIWKKFFITWNSGNSTSAKISIVNQSIDIDGNDFGLDDISFVPVTYVRDSIVIKIDKPSVVARGDTAVCPGIVVPLTASGALTYSWSPASGLSDPTSPNPMATVSNSTKYFVSGKNANGCVAKDSVTLTSLAKPTISTSPDTSICANGSAQLLVSGGINYQWTPAATLDNAFISNPRANPSASTTYTVLVTGSNGCEARDSVKVTLVSNPAITISNDTSICENTSTQLLAAGGTLYSWSPAVGLSNAAIHNPVASPAINTKYFVTATSSIGCASTDSVEIYILPKPQVSISGDTSICKDGTAVLVAAGAVSYQWTPPGTLSNSSASSPTAQPTSNTIYTVTGLGPNGCADRQSVSVSILPSPNISITADTAICQNSTVQLGATGGINYSWSPANGLSNPGIANPMATTGSDVRYTVRVEDAKGCAAMDSVYISIRPAAQFGVKSSSITGCVGESIQLGAYGGDSYVWTPATGMSNSNIAAPFVSLASSQIYMVTIRESVCNTQNSFPVSVNVVEGIQLNVTKSNDISCNVPAIQLYAGGEGATYTWSPADGLSNPGIANPIASPLVATTYLVTVTNTAGCESKGSIMVDVVKNGDFRLYQMPNAFTPNNDGNNDCFGVAKWGNVQIDYFEIFNRWGQMVFNSKSNGPCWDGRLNGIQQPSGNYVYKLRVQTFCGVVEQKGYVILIR